ncbi:MAG TPA: ArsI/CadI family heavy metal resistance metalloenzyme [Gemmataceae bacterium]|nr:ArsI/CadI family heavy metal resistance metalloenzyme [Gemmataceae bacterium]
MPSKALATTPAVRFHLSLNVADLSRSVAFYRVLFNMEPAKLRGDYAKFEPDDPPLVLSLEPTPRGAGGPLNHLGFRLPDAKTLVAMQERLERAGIRSQREEGVECCYAKQTKFWLTDPDGTLWEIYTLEADIEHRGAGQSLEAMVGAHGPEMEPVVWEHFLGQPVPDRAGYADGSIDEVRLRGSLNMPLGPAEQRRLVSEAKRVLRPGGRVFVHVLTAEKPIAGDLGLPGPAVVVRHAPVEDEPVRLLEEAGFTGVRMTKLDAQPCFVRNGVGMRELQLEGFRPAVGAGGPVEALYTGPFDQIEVGRVTFPRGRRVRVPADVARQLHAAGSFVVFDRPAGEAKHTADCGGSG